MAKPRDRMPEPLMDIPAVATICSVSEKTVRRWIAAQELPAAKLGNQWRIQLLPQCFHEKFEPR